MAALSSAFSPVYQAAGAVDAVCFCLPPRALGHRQSALASWWRRLFSNEQTRAQDLFLALSGTELISLSFDEDGELITQDVLQLDRITAARIVQRSASEHEVEFTYDGKKLSFVTCAYMFGSATGTPPELVENLRAMENDVLAAIRNRI